MNKNILLTALLCCFVLIFVSALIKTDLLEGLLQLFNKIPKALRIIIYILIIIGLGFLIWFEIKKFF